MAPSAAVPPIVAYLSSTLTDLKEERQAIKEVLSGTCVIRESYEPSSDDLVTKCLDDVASSEVYVGVIGLRYGFIPPGQKNSITSLEYEKAKSRGLLRYVFIKDGDAIAATQTDAYTDEHPKERILGFRKQLTSGAADEATPTIFSTVADLKLKVQKAISDLRLAKTGGTTVLGGERPHPWGVTSDLAIGYVPSTDAAMKAVLEGHAESDQRITLFELSPAQPKEYFASLDVRARRSRSLMLLITGASLTRFVPTAKDVAAAIATIRERSEGIFGLLVGVTPDKLPQQVREAFTDLFVTNTDDWSDSNRHSTFQKLQQWRRAKAPEVVGPTRVGVPYMVVALNDTEAKAMNADPSDFFKAFGPGAAIRKDEFEGLRTRLLQVAPNWPDGFYGPARQDWRPFGSSNEMLTMNEFALAAAKRVNAAPRGSRERRLLKNDQLVLLPYTFDEYVSDRGGSRENARRVCDGGCLVLLDEFALLHPKLRGEIDALLGSNTAAVVSISACDPTLRSLGELLSDLSYLRVGNLHSRFKDSEDLRCEVSLNSVARLHRWLRLVLPELLTTLGQEQIDLTLNVDDLFGSAVGAP